MKSINRFQKVFIAIVISMVAISSGCATGTSVFGENGMFSGTKLFPGVGDSVAASSAFGGPAPCSGSS